MISWFEKRKKLSAFILILIGAFIFIISSIRLQDILGRGVFKISWLSVSYHFVIFFLFGLFFLISTFRTGRIDIFLLAVVLSVLYGVLDEFHQLFVPGRFFSIHDILVDAIGVFVAAAGYLYRLNGSFERV